ncbi:MAG: uL30 family ribosomal protein [Candidatus Woesearchaeota archaeon]
MAENKEPQKKSEQKTKQAQSKSEATSKSSASEFVAVIRIRGGKKIDGDIKRTLAMLNLNNQHNMIILPAKSNYIGMIKKVKDYITWGVISSEIKSSIEKSAESKGKGLKPGQKVYRLHPPVGGFERKGIKTPYSMGGVLGDRSDKISNLINKMI